MHHITTGFFLILFAAVAHGQSLTASCDGSTSCSPSWCQSVTNAACVDPNAAMTVSNSDVSKNLDKMGCKVCTQSTAPQCSSSNLNSILIKNGGLKAVYCNDEFLVIHSSGLASHSDGLAGIPRPPGGGGGAGYASSCVTRTYHEQYATMKVPLNPQELSTASASNNKAAFVGQTDPAGYADYGLPTSGPVAYTTSGQYIFPLFNNVGVVSHEQCEVDKCSAHAGQGFDYHYHGDPFSNVPGRCMYSPANYTSDNAHPPQIGWSMDGFLLYGRHISTNNLGVNVSLDDCGGHSHDGLPYHYHAQVKNFVSQQGQAYTSYIGGVYKCWKGDITIANIFNTSGPNRVDNNQLKPCCSSTQYWLASGVTSSSFVGSNSSSSSNSSPSSSTASPRPPSSSSTGSASPSSSSNVNTTNPNSAFIVSAFNFAFICNLVLVTIYNLVL